MCKHHSPGDTDDHDAHSVDDGEDADGVDGDHVLDMEYSEWRALRSFVAHCVNITHNDDNDGDEAHDDNDDDGVDDGGDADGADGDHVLETECSEWRALYPLCKHHQTALVALCAAFATRRNCHSMKTNLVI